VSEAEWAVLEREKGKGCHKNGNNRPHESDLGGFFLFSIKLVGFINHLKEGERARQSRSLTFLVNNANKILELGCQFISAGLLS
jgi:hypothetical protein